MTAAQYSGSPLPLPIRVSSGMEVIDLCGKTRTYKRPSVRRYCCALIRPASIVCALSHPPCVACRPKSPNTTRLPRVASPFIRPLWLFRCLTLLGISAIAGLLVHALIDPYLHSDVSLCGRSLGQTVVDFGAQSRQRHRAVNLLFASR